MKKFKILSIDGGGLRGVVPLTILKKVEEISGKKIHQLFDLIVGTSTGGLITCAISLRSPDDPTIPLYSLDDVLNVYINRGSEIFPQYNWFQKKWHTAADAFNPRFTDEGIKKVFTDVVKDYRMANCLTEIMVNTYDLNNNITLFFKSRDARTNPAQNALLYDICRATSAGPTYLPSYSMKFPRINEETNLPEDPNRNCIDGGVFVNNPSMAALSEFSKNFKYYIPEAAKDASIKDIDYNNVYVLSLGTGSYIDKVSESDTESKGELFWATRISDIMMRGVNRTTDYEMKEMMVEGNYLRLSMTIDNADHADMSNSSAETIQYLLKATNDQVINDVKKMADLTALIQKMV